MFVLQSKIAWYRLQALSSPFCAPLGVAEDSMKVTELSDAEFYRFAEFYR